MLAIEKRNEEGLRTVLDPAHPTGIAVATYYSGCGVQRVTGTYADKCRIGLPWLHNADLGRIMFVRTPGDKGLGPIAPDMLIRHFSDILTKDASINSQ